MDPALIAEMTPAPGVFSGRSPFHLSAEQVRFFDENGYLILRKWITGPLLERLQRAGSAWIAQGDPDSAGARVKEKGSQDMFDYEFAQRENGKVMYRVNYLHNKGQRASLELLGDPRLLAVAESLCGVNFVPTYESMVFKQKGDGEKVSWHQDALHPHRRHRIFNFDLYLDASRKDAGAVRVVPGSHLTVSKVCGTLGETWEGGGIQVAEMEPGDVLLHDVMVVHGSPRSLGAELRRTIYYEFRAAEEILEDGPWDEAWIARRMRLLPVALKAAAEAGPGEAPFAWAVEPRFRPAPLGDEAVELKVAHEVHTPWAYCSAGNAGKVG